jgi:hypothetical protein
MSTERSKPVLTVSGSILPPGFSYPQDYIDNGIEDLRAILPWWIFHAPDPDRRLQQLRLRYPRELYVPFARLNNNDDIACFDGRDQSGAPRVILVHDFASAGWESRGEFSSYREWLQWAKADANELNSGRPGEPVQ